MSSQTSVAGAEQVEPGGYRLRGLVTLLGMVVFAAAVLFGLTAGVGAVWSAVTAGPAPSVSAAPVAAAPASSSPAVVQVKLSVNAPPLGGVTGPDHQVHDAFVPATFTMKVGTTYDVTVTNYDDMPHTWTAPDLNVNAQITPGSESKPSVTHFTITPTKAGTFEWFCATPCDGWAMTHSGYMRGSVAVTA